MSLHLTRICLLFVFAVINAQLYNDMGAAYTDQSSVYGDENTDDDGEYGSDYDAYDDGEDLAEILFSKEKLTELYTCMCLGTSQKCIVQYRLEGDTWSVSAIHRNGTFQGDNELCKYYLCYHDEVNQQISCSQMEQRSAACEAGSVAQFFRFKDHVCCGLTCVGLFWYSVEEQMSFMQNASETESCDASCLCPADGSEEVPMHIKISSNDSQVDTYIIHKPDRNVTTAETLTTMTNPSSHIPALNGRTSTTTTSNNSELEPLVKSPLSDSKEDTQTTFIIIVAASVAVVVIVILIIIVAFIIKRRKRQRQLKINSDMDLKAESAAVVGAEPRLNDFRPAIAGTSTTQYSRLPTGGADPSASRTYTETSKDPGFRNGTSMPESITKETKTSNANMKNDLSSQNSSGVKDGYNSGNRNAKNRMDDRPGQSTGLISDENEKGNRRAAPDIKDRSSPNKDVKLRQPLLLRPEVKESVV